MSTSVRVPPRVAGSQAGEAGRPPSFSVDALTIGFHPDISHDDYHADPAPAPSLSASIAKVLLSRSPLHAWQAHPRLGGGAPEKASDAVDRGTIVHGLLLGNGQAYVAVDADDWRTKAARYLRDQALREGRIPVLAGRLTEYVRAADEIRQRSRLGVLIEERMVATELTAVWLNDCLGGEVWCRARLDAWEPDAVTIHDLKTCEDARRSADGANIIRYGRDITAAAYTEAVETLRPELQGRVKYRFHFCEPDPPYGVMEAELTGELLELGRRKWRRAVETWGRCLVKKDWPGYSESVIRIEAPGWALEADMAEQLTADERGAAA